MFNNHDHHQMGPPRISFSSDFIDTTQELRTDLGSSYKEAPVSSDFEFSVKDYSSRLRPADEIFFQGKLLPGGDQARKTTTTLTLREELLAGDNPPARSSSGRWMERLGLKKSRRSSSSRGSGGGGGKTDLETVDEETVQEILTGKKEVLSEGRQSYYSRSSWMKSKAKEDQ